MVRAIGGSIAAASLLCALASPAHAEIPWPVDGAPICTAPGDQFGLLALDRFCLDGMAFSWFTRAAAADTLSPFGGIGAVPPEGGCSSALPPVASGAVVGEIATSRLSSGMVLGFPGCFDPAYPGHSWIARDALNDRVVVSVPYWFGHERTVVHSGDSASALTPVLAGSGVFGYIDTAVVVVWTDARTPPAQLRAQRVTWQGALEWGGADGIAVAPVGAGQGSPQALRLEDGSTLVVWTDTRSGSPDTYALRLLADGAPAPEWPATGLALESRSEESVAPRLLGGATEPPLVVWEESGARFGGGRSVVARRLLPDGMPDPAWSDSGVVLSSSATVERLEDAQWDVSGGLAVVWSDTRSAAPGNPTDVYAQRIGPDGERPAGWPASGRVVCTAQGRQDRACVSVRPGGFTVFAWEDLRSGAPDVYVTMLDPSGQTPCCDWLPDGTPASQAAGDQRRPVIRAGNEGGAFVAWIDGRDVATNGHDLYAQAFTVDGRKADVEPVAPPGFAALHAPVPNPSRGTARLRLELARAADVRVDVYDILGRHIRSVARGTLGAGLHDWAWDGTDGAGRESAAGLYRVRALVDGVARSRTFVRLR